MAKQSIQSGSEDVVYLNRKKSADASEGPLYLIPWHCKCMTVRSQQKQNLDFLQKYPKLKPFFRLLRKPLNAGFCLLVHNGYC